MITTAYFRPISDVVSNPRAGITFGSEARHYAYQDLSKNGYEWRTNCLIGESKSKKLRFELEGFDVIVDQRVFCVDGTIAKGLVAILTRGKEVLC